MELSKIYEEYFKSCGYDVMSFTDPLSVLYYYKQKVNQFSFILTDLRMSPMSEIELAYNMRKINHIVKILLITAFMTEDIVKNSEFIDA
jgi:CheY-like chemotaxis protein